MHWPAARSSLRVEDLALALANIVGVPLLGALGGASDGPAPLLGLIELLAVVGAIAALATRSAERGPLDPDSLVVAPRELAAPEPRPGAWFVRFLVFVVSAAIGVGGVLLL